MFITFGNDSIQCLCHLPTDSYYRYHFHLTALIFQFAVHKTEANDKGYYGFVATMDVYGYNLNGGQLSAAAIWINNDEGDRKQNLDAITVGWLVSFPCSRAFFHCIHHHFSQFIASNNLTAISFGFCRFFHLISTIHRHIFSRIGLYVISLLV